MVETYLRLLLALGSRFTSPLRRGILHKLAALSATEIWVVLGTYMYMYLPLFDNRDY